MPVCLEHQAVRVADHAQQHRYDSAVLVRDASNAIFLALAMVPGSCVLPSRPRIFFWFGQISTHTFNSMMVPSHAPRPITAIPAVNVNARRYHSCRHPVVPDRRDRSARSPRRHTEPQQSRRCDVLVDCSRTGATAVFFSQCLRDTGNLYEVEVVQQADPRNTASTCIQITLFIPIERRCQDRNTMARPERSRTAIVPLTDIMDS